MAVTVTPDATFKPYNSLTLKVITDGAKAYQGTTVPLGSGVAGQSYTISVAAVGPAAATLNLRFIEDGVGYTDSGQITLTGDVQRLSVSRTLVSSTTITLQVTTGSTTQAITFWIDKVQKEIGASRTPWTRTQRAAGRFQIPSTYFNSAAFWFTLRLRAKWSSVALPNTAPTFFEIGDQVSGGNGITIDYSGGNFNMRRLVNGAGAVASVAKSVADAEVITLGCVGTATQVGISVNGGNFTLVGNTSLPDLSQYALADLMVDMSRGQTRYAMANLLWAFTGQGPRSNADAAALAAIVGIPQITDFTAAHLLKWQYAGNQNLVFIPPEGWYVENVTS